MLGWGFPRRIKGGEPRWNIPGVVPTVPRSDSFLVECSRLAGENDIIKKIASKDLVRMTPNPNLHLTLGSPFHARVKTGTD